MRKLKHFFFNEQFEVSELYLSIAIAMVWLWIAFYSFSGGFALGARHGSAQNTDIVMISAAIAPLHRR